MAAHALVIGIDRYERPEWCLDGAVRDALAFAGWATTVGGVDPANLTLLLAPNPNFDHRALRLDFGDPGELFAVRSTATRDDINGALYRYTNEAAGRSAERLWFYFAGHGFTPPTSAPDKGPIIVPAGVTNLEHYVDYDAIGLDLFRGRMQDLPPKEQFFFIDACRDVLPSLGTKTLDQALVWNVREVDGEGLATQAVILAATSGQRAKEVHGRGVFASGLIRGLTGRGPNLSLGTPADPRMRLTFTELSAFIEREVKRQMEALKKPGQPEPRQVPHSSVNRLHDAITVARYDKAPEVVVRLYVEPEAARENGTAAFLDWSQAEGTYVPLRNNPAPEGPPIKRPASFRVRTGERWIRVTAPGFAPVPHKRLDVYQDMSEKVELQPEGPSLLGGELEALEAARPTTGGLSASSPDPFARLTVLDGGGTELGSGYGSLKVGRLHPGVYRVVAQVDAASRSEEIVTIEAGREERISVDLATTGIGGALSEELSRRDISSRSGYLYPSEHLSGVANAGLGSVLAYAAWAARWPPSEFHRLRNLGVDRLHFGPGEGAVQLVIGDAVEMRDRREKSAARLRPARVASEPQPRIRPTMIIGRSGEVVTSADEPLISEEREVPLVPLSGLPRAAQAGFIAMPGMYRLTVDVHGFVPAAYALAVLPGFVTVLVVSREADGHVEVQQHFAPADPGVPASHPGDVRIVEISSRALLERSALPLSEFMELEDRAVSNPMLGVVSAYRAARSSRSLSGDRRAEYSSALAKVTRALQYRYPGLPDVHVLAGLSDPAARDAHFERAAKSGTPVIADGFWTLLDWLTERAAQDKAQPPWLWESLLPGIAWTAFVGPTPAPTLDAVRLISPSGSTRIEGGIRPAILASHRAVGRLDKTHAGAEFYTSCFLIAPDVAICPYHLAREFASEEADASWSLDGSVFARFDTDTRKVSAVLGIARLGTIPPGGEPLDPTMIEQCWPVLLQLDGSAAGPVPVIAARGPETGQRVAVIGFPRSDARIPPGLFVEHFEGAAGEKHVMSGTLLARRGLTLTYDCFTADGTSGGPLIDATTGEILGMHVAGTTPVRGRKQGFAVSLSAFRDHPVLLGAGARFG